MPALTLLGGCCLRSSASRCFLHSFFYPDSHLVAEVLSSSQMACTYFGCLALSFGFDYFRLSGLGLEVYFDCLCLAHFVSWCCHGERWNCFDFLLGRLCIFDGQVCNFVVMSTGRRDGCCFRPSQISTASHFASSLLDFARCAAVQVESSSYCYCWLLGCHSWFTGRICFGYHSV